MAHDSYILNSVTAHSISQLICSSTTSSCLKLLTSNFNIDALNFNVVMIGQSVSASAKKKKKKRHYVSIDNDLDFNTLVDVQVLSTLELDSSY